MQKLAIKKVMIVSDQKIVFMLSSKSLANHSDY
jgi:hypothetical protein